MKSVLTSRRKFLVTGSAIAAATYLNGQDLTGSPVSTAAAKEFLSKWERAWNNHDAHQLCLLHTPDANTVNRFGTLVQGRVALEKALGFFTAPVDPFMRSPRRFCN